MVKQPLNKSYQLQSRAVSNQPVSPSLEKKEHRAIPDCQPVQFSGYHLHQTKDSYAISHSANPIIQLEHTKGSAYSLTNATAVNKQNENLSQDHQPGSGYERTHINTRFHYQLPAQLQALNNNYLNNSGKRTSIPVANSILRNNNLLTRIVQLVRKKVSQKNRPTWYWTDEQKGIWQGYEVPLHPCHSQKVGENDLIGGYTVIDEKGKYIHSKTYGPYSPIEGPKDEGHVERQLLAACEGALKTSMADDTTFGDTVLVLLEINQWNTPCSGPKGCTTFLNNKIAELNGIYEEVTAAGRFKAYTRYDSSLSETHPARAAAIKSGAVKEEDDDEALEYNEKEAMVSHTWTKEDRESASFSRGRSRRRTKDESSDDEERARSLSPGKKEKKSAKKTDKTKY